nr:MAG TPA: hypothetical protein [Caudoviricetes sp.]
MTEASFPLKISQKNVIIAEKNIAILFNLVFLIQSMIR